MRNPSTGAEQEGQHAMRPNEPDVVGGPVEATGYAWGGVEVPAHAHEALAKKVYDPATGRTGYWLKRATAGPDAGKLYNPQSPTFNADAARRVHDDLGRGRYEFRRATPQSFEFYLRFLSGGNPVHVRNAERY